MCGCRKKSKISGMKKSGVDIELLAGMGAGTIVAGMASKQVPFLSTTGGNAVKAIGGVMLQAKSKNKMVKGAGLAIAVEGIAGLMQNFGIAGLPSNRMGLSRGVREGRKNAVLGHPMHQPVRRTAVV